MDTTLTYIEFHMKFRCFKELMDLFINLRLNKHDLDVCFVSIPLRNLAIILTY